MATIKKMTKLTMKIRRNSVASGFLGRDMDTTVLPYQLRLLRLAGLTAVPRCHRAAAIAVTRPVTVGHPPDGVGRKLAAHAASPRSALPPRDPRGGDPHPHRPAARRARPGRAAAWLPRSGSGTAPARLGVEQVLGLGVPGLVPVRPSRAGVASTRSSRCRAAGCGTAHRTARCSIPARCRSHPA